jgi:hypothetical protein
LCEFHLARLLLDDVHARILSIERHSLIHHFTHILEVTVKALTVVMPLAFALALVLISCERNSPFPVAPPNNPPSQTEWSQVDGLGGSGLTSSAVVGTNFFAGTSNGLFVSTDGGTSWTATGLTNTYVSSLAVSGTNLFAGTGGGVFLSTNNGTSWTPVNTGLTNADVRALAVSGTNLFAGTDDGVSLSTNYGTSWVTVNIGITGTPVFALAVSGMNLFAGTGNGVFVSTNSGASWTGGGTSIGLRYRLVEALAVSGSNLFAGGVGALYLSSDNGASWTTLYSTPSLWIHALVISGGNVFAADDEPGEDGIDRGGVFLWSSQGWTSTGLVNIDVRALAVSGTSLFAGSDYGRVWRRPL